MNVLTARFTRIYRVSVTGKVGAGSAKVGPVGAQMKADDPLRQFGGLLRQGT